MAEVLKSSCNDASSKVAVLKLQDLADEARRVVLDARRQAAQIIAEAQASAAKLGQEIREKAYAEGLAAGKDDGLRQGIEQGRQHVQQGYAEQVKQASQLAEQLCKELAEQKDQLIQQAQQGLLELAITIACRIVGQVAADDIDAASANLEKALRKLSPAMDAAVIHVNPSQLPLLQEHCRQLTRQLEMSGLITLQADPEISAGGVKITSESGLIDATIEKQIANITSAILGHDRASFTGGRSRSRSVHSGLNASATDDRTRCLEGDYESV